MASEGDFVPGWLRATVWGIAISLAALGVVLALVSGSFLPLVALFGLAVPMVPLGRRRGAGAGSTGQGRHGGAAAAGR
ncbi:hypothetical protein V6S02_06045 [Microbacterium sp. CCNWLW134]|uniref:hypothetical protein n=1 Tax=Microbacterium sp. CCNWLW134 TaxID=3122064 RepID=UPI00301060DA